MSAVYVLSWLLPWLAGTAVYLAVAPGRAAGWRASAIGYGFFSGMLLAGLVTSIVARSDTARAWASGDLCLLPALVAAGAIAWRRRGVEQPSSRDEALPSRWQWAILVALLVSLAVRSAIAAREIWLRPTYPWDAWAAWAVKPKVWFLLGHYAPFAPMAEWLRATEGNLYTGIAWHYPGALAWIEVWFASAAGAWIEPLINLPWFGLWIALLLGHNGQWRALGLDRMRALIFVYALGSLPLLLVHAALAGYADLWVATAFGFGVLAWMRWLQHGDRSQLCVAIVCALSLPWLKMEGAVWACCLLAAIGFGSMPKRWRRIGVVGAMALFVVLFPLGGLRFLCPHAEVTNADGSVAMSALGPLVLLLNLHWHSGVLEGAAQALLAHPNWHLLWWLAPAILAWRWRALVAHDWLRLPAALLGLCIALLLFLFLFTEAGHWAQSFTAINRLALQLTPALVTVLAMLLRDVRLSEAPRDTVPVSAPRSDPG